MASHALMTTLFSYFSRMRGMKLLIYFAEGAQAGFYMPFFRFHAMAAHATRRRRRLSPAICGLSRRKGLTPRDIPAAFPAPRHAKARLHARFLPRISPFTVFRWYLMRATFLPPPFASQTTLPTLMSHVNTIISRQLHAHYDIFAACRRRVLCFSPRTAHFATVTQAHHDNGHHACTGLMRETNGRRTAPRDKRSRFIIADACYTMSMRIFDAMTHEADAFCASAPRVARRPAADAISAIDRPTIR